MNIKPILKTAGSLLVCATLAVSAFGAPNVSHMKGRQKVNVPAPTTVVGAIMVTNDNWNSASPDAGVYYIEVRPDGAITPQYKSAAMADVVCALKKDNIMYTAEATSDYRFYYRQMSMSDWSTIGSRQEIDLEDVPAGLTYDASLGKAYGSFWNDNYQGFSFFGNFNLTSASWTSIDKVQRDERDIFALAADGKGTIYCLFGAYDYLATIDPVTGQINRIKTTGFEIDTNWAEGRVSSMCYDEENDRLIATVSETLGWGANKTYQSGLYTINPHTGDVEKIMAFDGNACFAGLYVVDAATDANAPGEPINLKANINGVSTTGTVSFTMPTKTFGGADLSGSLMAIISVNGVETVVPDLTPGQNVTSPVLNFNNGENTVKVTIADEVRRGGSQSIEFWAGEDIPMSVANVVLNVSDGKGILTWDAPTQGAHNGPITAQNIKYKVVRMPEQKTVSEALTGTTFEDNSIDTSIKTIYYVVTAYNGAGSAEGVESNRCLSVGSFKVPFMEGFNTADDFALWTIEDVNGGATWKYNGGQTEQVAEYEYDSNKLPADDWLISPPIRLEADKTYKLSYKWRVMMKSYPESFEVRLGNAANSASMTTQLGNHPKVSNTSFESADKSFTVDKDGDYYIGIHCYSDGYMYILRIDDVAIDEIDSRVPATVNDLTVVPAENGVHSAMVKFTVPEVDNKGGKLESVTSATISRDGKQLTVLSNVNPGQKIEYTDNTIDSDGFKTYSVYCSNSVGDGVAATIQSYIGVDAPGAVQNLSIAEVSNHPVLKWDAPTQGINGGWFDANAVVYRIVRSDGKVVTEDCKDTQYTDLTYTSPAVGQDAVWYLVTPYVGTTKGAYAQSELLLCGNPYKAPLTETFAKADMVYYPWISQSSNAVNYAWTLDNMGYNPQTSDWGGDQGLATFHSVGEPEGVVSYFYSPKFELSPLENPALSFYMYHSEEEGDGKVEILVSAGTDTFSEIEGSVPFMRTDAKGWVRHTIDLSAYKNVPWLRIGFKATGDGVADIYIDNVEIHNRIATDLALTSLTVPFNIAAGESVHGTATVTNNGVNDVDNAKLKIIDAAGSLLTTVDIPEIASGNSIKVEFTIETRSAGSLKLNAVVEAAGDGDTSNNAQEATVKVVEPVVNAPENLNGASNNGDIVLTWDAPRAEGVVLDDVESYPDWAIDGIGQWTMWDGDYDITYSINNPYGDYPNGDYPNATSRKAFQICNADKLGINIWDEGKTHSGNKMFMAMCSYIYVNNDWLISPQLNGREQWINFYARSFTLQGIAPERMRVWYSTTDNDPANFVEITTSYVELPGTWQQYSYYLPEGAKYFAINCVSDGSFAMFIDDLSFNDLTVPTWQLQYYEIYMNGQKIGESHETQFSLPSENIGTGAKFAVKAIYDRGEGPLSKEVSIESRVGEVLTSSVNVVGKNGEVIICGAVDCQVSIINTAGNVVYSNVCSNDEVHVSVAPGIYLVKVNNEVFKVVVR